MRFTILILVHEAAQGGADLNGDSDANDKVLHYVGFWTGGIAMRRTLSTLLLGAAGALPVAATAAPRAQDTPAGSEDPGLVRQGAPLAPTLRPRAVVEIGGCPFEIHLDASVCEAVLRPWATPDLSKPAVILPIPVPGGRTFVPASITELGPDTFLVLGTEIHDGEPRLLALRCAVVTHEGRFEIRSEALFRDESLTGNTLCAWTPEFPEVVVLFDLETHSLHYLFLEDSGPRLAKVLSVENRPQLPEIRSVSAQFATYVDDDATKALWISLETTPPRYWAMCGTGSHWRPPRVDIFDHGADGRELAVHYHPD